jgi:membrane-bound ClpP family serine protease
VSTWVKYLLFQVPGWVVAALVLTVLRIWTKLSLETAVGLFGLWVIKDILFYPLLRIAYQAAPRTVVEQLIGLKGVAREPLDPSGYVQVRGELWRAEAEPGGPTIAAGAGVRVLRAQGMTLIVGREGAPQQRR